MYCISTAINLKVICHWCLPTSVPRHFSQHTTFFNNASRLYNMLFVHLLPHVFSCEHRPGRCIRWCWNSRCESAPAGAGRCCVLQGHQNVPHISFLHYATPCQTTHSEPSQSNTLWVTRVKAHRLNTHHPCWRETTQPDRASIITASWRHIWILCWIWAPENQFIYAGICTLSASRILPQKMKYRCCVSLNN